MPVVVAEPFPEKKALQTVLLIFSKYGMRQSRDAQKHLLSGDKHVLRGRYPCTPHPPDTLPDLFLSLCGDPVSSENSVHHPLLTDPGSIVPEGRGTPALFPSPLLRNASFVNK